ncbi:MAG: hypothetical protein LBJ45_02915 [Holosporaceae bacterium]|nr:hypothetical protein [Holosporaceae bacterium]
MKKTAFASALAAAFAGTVSANDVDEAYGSDLWNGIFFGIGIGGTVSSKDTFKSLENGHETSKNSDRFDGRISLGSGKVMSAYPVYLGGELSVDFAKTKNSSQNFDSRDIRLRNNGIAPSLCFRIGYVTASSTLFFVKAGAVYGKSVVEYDGWRLTNARLAPIIALGVEKGLSKKITFRGDLEYRLKNTKKNDRYELERGHAVALKCLFVYHVKY